MTPSGELRTVRLRAPLDLRATLAPFRQGRFDLSLRLGSECCWRATRTPEGPASLRLAVVGDELTVEAWGPGRAWALEHAAGLVGLDHSEDEREIDAVLAGHRLLGELRRRLPGLRIPRSSAVAEALAPTIIEQKVTGLEAKRSYRHLVSTLGERAPGPAGLMVPPAPAVLAATPPWVYHRAGVERRRAETIRGAMVRAARLEETTAMALPDAYRRLQALPGVGPWTAATVALMALGDLDAVPFGDYHLPDQVSWGLAGEPRGDDERMVELLEPYRGRRALVLRLLVAGGIQAPRRGPRFAPRAIAAH